MCQLQTSNAKLGRAVKWKCDEAIAAGEHLDDNNLKKTSNRALTFVQEEGYKLSQTAQQNKYKLKH